MLNTKRPNSAIYLGSETESAQAAQASQSQPTTPLRTPILEEPIEQRRQLGQLPSPPHTNSTSGSTGDANSNKAASVRRKLPPLPRIDSNERLSQDESMQNGNYPSPSIEPHAFERQVKTLADRNREILERLDKFGSIGLGRHSQGLSSSSRIFSDSTSSLGKSVGSPFRRTTSLSFSRTQGDPPLSPHITDSASSIEPLSDHSSSSSLLHSDRSRTPPAHSANNSNGQEVSPQRQRLSSEPTSPHRMNLLKKGIAALSRSGGSGGKRSSISVFPRERSDIEEDDSDAMQSSPSLLRKSRSGIPVEFLTQTSSPLRQTSPEQQRMLSHQHQNSNSSSTTLSPRVFPTQNSYLSAPTPPNATRTPSPNMHTLSAQGSPSLAASSATLTSSVSTNTGNSSGGIKRPTRASTIRERQRWESGEYEDTEEGLVRKDRSEERPVRRESGLRSVVNETLQAAGLAKRRTSRDALRDFVSSPTERQSPALATPSERDDIFNPPNRTIHGVLDGSRTSTSMSRDRTMSFESGGYDGRATPAQLRQFKSAYNGQQQQYATVNSVPMLKSYTSPSGVQRILPIKSSVYNPATYMPPPVHSPTSSGPVQLLQDALFMFESHVQRVPQASLMPETYAEVVRDARGIVTAASGLNRALRAALAVAIDEEIETGAQPNTANQEGEDSIPDIWKRIGDELKEDVKVSDELVRALTSFMIGTGRMLRSASSGGGSFHTRMVSLDGGSIVTGSGGGSSEGRKSNDGRRSVDARMMSTDGRRSVEGRRTGEPSPYLSSRRTAEEHREETFRRLTAGRSETGSDGSGGRLPRPGSRLSHESRPSTALSVARELPSTTGTFTSLGSMRRTTAPTGSKALPKLPMPSRAGFAAFPQTDDGGDRTPIDHPVPHTRHSTLPPQRNPPPLATIPSESLVRSRSAAVRNSRGNSVRLMPSSTVLPTTAVATTSASPAKGDTATASMRRARLSTSSAAQEELQQISATHPLSSRKRTISAASDASEEPPSAYIERLPRAGASMTADTPTQRSSVLSPTASSSSRARPFTARRSSSSAFSGNSASTLTPTMGRARPLGKLTAEPTASGDEQTKRLRSSRVRITADALARGRTSVEGNRTEEEDRRSEASPTTISADRREKRRSAADILTR